MKTNKKIKTSKIMLKGGAFGEKFNNARLTADDTETSMDVFSNNQKIILYVLLIYFGSRIYFNIYSLSINPDTKTKKSSVEILNFGASFILLFLYIFIKNPVINEMNMSSWIAIIIALIISLSYCSTTLILENQTTKEIENNVNNKKQYITYLIFAIYLVIAFICLWLGFVFTNNKLRVFLGVGVVIIIYIALILIGNKNNRKINITPGLYLYALLFILPNINSELVYTMRHILLVSSFSIFSFLGVRYFTGDVTDSSSLDTNQTCQNNDIESETPPSQNHTNNNNYKNLYIGLVSMSCLFVLVLVFLYTFMENGISNK
jgi:hypothetical protein